MNCFYHMFLRSIKWNFTYKPCRVSTINTIRRNSCVYCNNRIIKDNRIIFYYNSIFKYTIFSNSHTISNNTSFDHGKRPNNCILPDINSCKIKILSHWRFKNNIITNNGILVKFNCS